MDLPPEGDGRAAIHQKMAVHWLDKQQLVAWMPEFDMVCGCSCCCWRTAAVVVRSLRYGQGEWTQFCPHGLGVGSSSSSSLVSSTKLTLARDPMPTCCKLSHSLSQFHNIVEHSPSVLADGLGKELNEPCNWPYASN